jgi:hypothetical protein
MKEINVSLMFWTIPGGETILSNGIIRSTAWLCLITMLLASCAPVAEAQSLANNEALPAPTQSDVQAVSEVNSEVKSETLPTPEPLPTLPADFDPAALLKDGSLEIEKLPVEAGIVRSGEGMLLIIYPLLQDPETGAYVYDRQHEITLLKPPAGLLLGTGDQYALRTRTAGGQTAVQELQVAVLPHLVGGQPFLGLAVLSAGMRNLENGAFQTEQTYAQPAEDSILADATYFGGRDTIYPNKVANILIAVSYMAEYQGDSGSFKARDGYSFNNLIRLRGGDTLRYANGADNLWAAGVCAVASLTSATLYQLSQALEVDYTNSLTSIIRTQYQHKIAAPYAGSPYIPVNVDTVVAVLPDVTADLVWQMPPEPAMLYLDINAAVIPNAVPYEDTAADGIGGPSDAEMLVTLAFTSQDPGPQAGALQSLLSSYRMFRSSQHANVQGKLQHGQVVGYHSWGSANWSEIAEAILPLD